MCKRRAARFSTGWTLFSMAIGAKKDGDPTAVKIVTSTVYDDTKVPFPGSPPLPSTGAGNPSLLMA